MAKYVILIDEMCIKEGLVYDKSSGSLIGYSDLGDVVLELQDYEEPVASNTPPNQSSTKTIMVFMVRGIFFWYQVPICSVPKGIWNWLWFIPVNMANHWSSWVQWYPCNGYMVHLLTENCFDIRKSCHQRIHKERCISLFWSSSFA